VVFFHDLVLASRASEPSPCGIEASTGSTSTTRGARARRRPMIKYALPDLRYDYGALEPHVSGKIMQLHHDKHHRAYVEAANKALEGLSEARAKDDFEKVPALERALAFNASGHVLHSIFWQNLAPGAGGEPDGALMDALRGAFGSFEAFKKQLVKAASTIMGSGWGALAWDPLRRCLVTVQVHDHQSETVQAGVLLLVLDAWEHAYYLQYQTEKAKYFEAVWNLWNWADVSARFDAARGLDLLLPGTVAAGGAKKPRAA
jgi:superoxide dismutase, Fe-Mn family